MGNNIKKSNSKSLLIVPQEHAPLITAIRKACEIIITISEKFEQKMNNYAQIKELKELLLLIPNDFRYIGTIYDFIKLAIIRMFEIRRIIMTKMEFSPEIIETEYLKNKNIRISSTTCLRSELIKTIDTWNCLFDDY
jgi:hypothetical protein